MLIKLHLRSKQIGLTRVMSLYWTKLCYLLHPVFSTGFISSAIMFYLKKFRDNCVFGDGVWVCWSRTGKVMSPCWRVGETLSTSKHNTKYLFIFSHRTWHYNGNLHEIIINATFYDKPTGSETRVTYNKYGTQEQNGWAPRPTLPQQEPGGTQVKVTGLRVDTVKTDGQTDQNQCPRSLGGIFKVVQT